MLCQLYIHYSSLTTTALCINIISYIVHCSCWRLSIVLLTLVLDSRCSGFVLAVSTVQFLLFLFGSAWYYTDCLCRIHLKLCPLAWPPGTRPAGWLCHQNVFLAFFTCLFSNNYVFSISDILEFLFYFGLAFKRSIVAPVQPVVWCVRVCVHACVCMRACVWLAGCSNVELCTTAQVAAF